MDARMPVDRRTFRGSRPVLGGFAWAVVAITAAVLVRRLADPLLDGHLPYAAMFAATSLVAWFAGLRPALVVVAGGGLAANFFIVAPRGVFDLDPVDPHQRWAFALFLVLGTVLAVFGGYGRAQRARAETVAQGLRDAEAALREAHDVLELRVQERTAELAASNASLRAAEERQRNTEELRRKSEELELDNRRMQEASRLQAEFMANMSHELRTPLNAVIGFADLLHAGLVGPVSGEQRELLADILHSSRHLLQLINQVLDLAKVESGTFEIAPEPCELRPVLAEVHDILRVTAAPRRIALELDASTGLGSATVDPSKLRQILYNYGSNAIKFTPDGGRVMIRATADDRTVRIEVEDTGIGIAPEDLRYLFVAFRQLDTGATKRYGGTGLGLALTKRLAEAHGGCVGVHSTRGAGSTFWVELPRIAAAPAAPALR